MKNRVFRSSNLIATAVLLAASFAGPMVIMADANADEISDKWQNSPHADSDSPSFTHWDKDGVVNENCAACHSSTGFRDYIGEDGSAEKSIDQEHPVGTTVDCAVCHNDTVKNLEQVTFPSGAIVDNLQSSQSCMVCHQGRNSTVSVNEKIAGLAEDTVDESLGFINIHYKAAAATLYGTEVKGGYEYDGKRYVGRFAHVPGVDNCVGCHDAHSLEVMVDTCASCHSDTLSDIKMSSVDFDGDGSAEQGVAQEIQALHARLGEAIMRYGKTITDAPIIYASGRYPYYFNDLNANDTADDDEAAYPNKYQSWTPRLLKAAYNYQFVAVDPGVYSHNPKYALQLLYDSLDDLGKKVDVNLESATRP